MRYLSLWTLALLLPLAACKDDGGGETFAPPAVSPAAPAPASAPGASPAPSAAPAQIGGTYVATLTRATAPWMEEGVELVVYEITVPPTASGPFVLSEATLRVKAIEAGEPFDVTLPLTGSGTYTPPAISLTTVIEGKEPDTLEGTVSADGRTVSFVDSDGAGIVYQRR